MKFRIPETLAAQNALHVDALDDLATAMGIKNVFDDSPRAPHRERVLVGVLPNA